MHGMTVVRLSDSYIFPVCIAVQISFQRSTQTVRENSGCVPLQLQSSGLYGRRFSVSFTCIPVLPVEAKGTIIVLDCDRCGMCPC